MQVHIETFKHSSTDVYQSKRGPVTIERHTVEVTINRVRRPIPCGTPFRAGTPDARLDLYGLAVRFSTGSKVWPGSATYWYASGNVNNLNPNIDKRGHFQLVGFFADHEESAHRSQHNAVA